MVKLILDCESWLKEILTNIFKKIPVGYGEITAQITSNTNDNILDVFKNPIYDEHMTIYYSNDLMVFHSSYNFKPYFKCLYHSDIYWWSKNGHLNHYIVSKLFNIGMATASLLISAIENNYVDIFKVNNFNEKKQVDKIFSVYIHPIIWARIELNHKFTDDKNKFTLDLIRCWYENNPYLYPSNLMDMFLSMISFSGKTNFAESFNELIECVFMIAERCPVMYHESMLGSTIMTQLMLRMSFGCEYIGDIHGFKKISISNFREFYDCYRRLIKQNF